MIAPALTRSASLRPPAEPVDETAVLAFLQQVADTAVTWLAVVDWAGVVVALDGEPFVAAGCAAPGAGGPGAAGAVVPVTPMWPAVTAPAAGVTLLLSTPVVVAGRLGGSVLLGGAGDLDDTAVELAEELARAVGGMLTAQVPRGRSRVADEIRFAVLARPGCRQVEQWVRHQGLEPRTR